ncbi:MAG TPA: histidine kinase [Ideonella sp.]|uniref:sensor histidine kinase n=1 Tax=Ideonella sp. TaxID=1929293 RepID=UPI002B93B27A|nr:histidine kinase [Ideonella sp.]HSI51958.1 histidine kinase [Ideonella sp.]
MTSFAPPANTPPNALQRWLLSRMALDRATWPTEQRELAESLDRLIVGRFGVGLGTGLLGAVIGASAGLHANGLRWPVALLLSTLYFAGLCMVGLRAWRQPGRMVSPEGRKRMLRIALLMAVATYSSTLALAWRQREGSGWPAWDEWPALLWAATPLQLLIGLMTMLFLWLISAGRKAQLEQALGTLQLKRERDQAARELAETRLRMLQVQIQPHFIFNTLAALQHWVDSGDARAPSLLRALTGFLRASTETLSRAHIPLAEEAATVAHYLAIQQARLGTRLQTAQSLPPEAGALPLPPGLLLTLVENAIEHGVSPALAGGEIRLGGARQTDGWAIWVDNTGQPLAEPLPPEGVGLRNCRERLQRLAGPQATLALQRQADGSTRAALWLPEAVR